MNETDNTRAFFQALVPHLRELRKRIILSVLSVALTTSLSFLIADHLMAFLAEPVGGLNALHSLEITENLTASFEVALLGGIVFAFPFIAYQAIAFIIPGLKENERRWVKLILPSAAFLFVVGLSFGYWILLPTAIPFLTSFMGIETQLRTGSYFSFTTSILFWIGVLFELPIVVFLLTKARILSSALLLKKWRFAIVVIAILAMVLTPTVDPVNMILLMAPLVGLYFLGAGLAKFAESKSADN